MTRATLFGGAALTVAMLLSPALAAAQTATPTESEVEVEELVVTAQKREQKLIEVPQSVTVVGEQALERQQATSFQDYLNLVPGLQLTQSTPGQGRLVLRGVNTGSVAATVAVYVDETPVGSSTGLVNGAVLASDFDTFDVDRIEVLRGPQGTLYGASSLGGVLRFVTNEPSTAGFEARARANVESVEDGEVGGGGAGMVNIPLGDTFAVRGSAYYRRLGGFIDSIGTAGSDRAEDTNGSESFGGRLSALWRPNERLSVRVSGYAQNLEVDSATLAESDEITLEPLYGRQTLSQFVPTFTDTEYRLYNATVDYDLGFATLTSSTSYNELDQTFRDDLTSAFSALLEGAFGFPPNEFLQNQTTAYEKTTQELRLASAEDERFEWLVGGYYTKEEGAIRQDLVAVVPGTLTPLTGLPALGNVSIVSDYEEYAVFGNATLKFTDRFEVTAGARYSENEQEALQVNDGLLAGGPAVLPVARSSEEVFTWSLAPRFELSDNASLYARVAKGFRPGGPNVLSPAAPAGTPRTYDSDELTSYEVGFKGDFAGGAVTVDVAAFHLDWKDVQVFGSLGGFGFNANGGQAEVDGVEFTVSTTPMEGLTVALNGAYTQSELVDDTPPEVGGIAGDRLPYTPDLNASLNIDYAWTVMDGADAFVGGSLRALSNQTAEYDFGYRSTNGQQRLIPSYEVLDLRAGIDFGRFGVEGYARNVNDADGRTSTGGLGFYPNGALGVGQIRPRTIGVAVTAEF